MKLLLGMTGVGGWLGKLNEHTNGWMISTENCGWQRCINQFLRVMTHFHPTSLPGPREPSAHCTLFKTSMAEAVNLFMIISLFISNNLFAHQSGLSSKHISATLCYYVFLQIAPSLIKCSCAATCPKYISVSQQHKRGKKWATQAISTCS